MSNGGRVLYLDAFSGMGGDMLCAALLDLGVVDVGVLESALDALPFPTEVRHERADRRGIDARRFLVEEERAHAHRTQADIDRLLADSPLPEAVRSRARATFAHLAAAEGAVHGRPPEEVTFHEVGALDSIVDVVAASALLAALDAEVVCSPLPLGRGFVMSAHGRLPLPAPATLRLLEGMPTYDGGVEAELVTPTAAALLRTWVDRFERAPAMVVRHIGHGAGQRDLADRPNVLRAVLGDSRANGTSRRLLEISANVDDATPEALAYALERAREAGARDAWTSPIGMKKGRAATMIVALVDSSRAREVQEVLWAETPTLGLRVSEVRRLERPRRVLEVSTRFGSVPVKIADGDGRPTHRKPEHDVCARLAREHGVPLREVVAAALAAVDAS